MGNKEKQIAYKNKYNKENYDRVTVMMPKGKKERVKERADDLHKSVSKYINDVIDEDLNHTRG